MVKKVSDTFETVLVVKWILTILKLCMALLAAITVSSSCNTKVNDSQRCSQEQDTAIALRMIFFIIPMSLQVLLPCFISTESTVASEKLSINLFHSNWTDESGKFKKNMQIFMQNS
jgi:hypothetical protein